MTIVFGPVITARVYAAGIAGARSSTALTPAPPRRPARRSSHRGSPRRGRGPRPRRGDPRCEDRLAGRRGGAGVSAVLERAPAIPAAYTRAVITGPNTIVMEQVALPPLAPDQVLVRVTASALCTWE